MSCVRWLRYGHWFTLGFVAVAFVGVVSIGELAPTAEPAAADPAAVGSAGRLVDAHDCWTGDAPANVGVPGHAVVTWPGAPGPAYGGARAVDAALDHLFGDVKTPGLVVHAFCR